MAMQGGTYAAKAIIQLTGIQLDGAMIVRFAGLRTMVDAVGGIDIQNHFGRWGRPCAAPDRG